MSLRVGRIDLADVGAAGAVGIVVVAIIADEDDVDGALIERLISCRGFMSDFVDLLLLLLLLGDINSDSFSLWL